MVGELGCWACGEQVRGSADRPPVEHGAACGRSITPLRTLRTRMVNGASTARSMRAMTKKLQGYGARGLTARPTMPLSISMEAAAGIAPVSSLMHGYNLPDPRSNTTKLREMLQSDELEFLMEAHVRTICIAPQQSPRAPLFSLLSVCCRTDYPQRSLKRRVSRGSGRAGTPSQRRSACATATKQAGRGSSRR